MNRTVQRELPYPQQQVSSNLYRVDPSQTTSSSAVASSSCHRAPQQIEYTGSIEKPNRYRNLPPRPRCSNGNDLTEADFQLLIQLNPNDPIVLKAKKDFNWKSFWWAHMQIREGFKAGPESSTTVQGKAVQNRGPVTSEQGMLPIRQFTAVNVACNPATGPAKASDAPKTSQEVVQKTTAIDAQVPATSRVVRGAASQRQLSEKIHPLSPSRTRCKREHSIISVSSDDESTHTQTATLAKSREDADVYHHVYPIPQKYGPTLYMNAREFRVYWLKVGHYQRQSVALTKQLIRVMWPGGYNPAEIKRAYHTMTPQDRLQYHPYAFDKFGRPYKKFLAACGKKGSRSKRISKPSAPPRSCSCERSSKEGDVSSSHSDEEEGECSVSNGTSRAPLGPVGGESSEQGAQYTTSSEEASSLEFVLGCPQMRSPVERTTTQHDARSRTQKPDSAHGNVSNEAVQQRSDGDGSDHSRQHVAESGSETCVIRADRCRSQGVAAQTEISGEELEEAFGEHIDAALALQRTDEDNLNIANLRAGCHSLSRNERQESSTRVSVSMTSNASDPAISGSNGPKKASEDCLEAEKNSPDKANSEKKRSKKRASKRKTEDLENERRQKKQKKKERKREREREKLDCNSENRKEKKARRRKGKDKLFHEEDIQHDEEDSPGTPGILVEKGRPSKRKASEHFEDDSGHSAKKKKTGERNKKSSRSKKSKNEAACDEVTEEVHNLGESVEPQQVNGTGVGEPNYQSEKNVQPTAIKSTESQAKEEARVTSAKQDSRGQKCDKGLVQEFRPTASTDETTKPREQERLLHPEQQLQQFRTRPRNDAPARRLQEQNQSFQRPYSTQHASHTQNHVRRARQTHWRSGPRNIRHTNVRKRSNNSQHQPLNHNRLALNAMGQSMGIWPNSGQYDPKDVAAGLAGLGRLLRQGH